MGGFECAMLKALGLCAAVGLERLDVPPPPPVDHLRWMGQLKLENTCAYPYKKDVILTSDETKKLADMLHGKSVRSVRFDPKATVGRT